MKRSVSLLKRMVHGQTNLTKLFTQMSHTVPETAQTEKGNLTCFEASKKVCVRVAIPACVFCMLHYLID